MEQRLIDAEALRYAIEKRIDNITDEDFAEGMAEAITEIDLQPTIDAEPVRHGKWIEGKCTRCGEHAPYWSMATTYYKSNFCPNCGAYMRGKEDG